MIFYGASFSCLWRTKFDCTILFKEYVEKYVWSPSTSCGNCFEITKSSRLIPLDLFDHILLATVKVNSADDDTQRNILE